MDTQRNISSAMDIQPKFRTKCQGNRKTHFDNQDDKIRKYNVPLWTHFRVKYYVMIDGAIASLTTKFKQMTNFDYIFGFLFDS
jgi:hypothetical protein